ncbi:MBG domain-containing protein [Flavobacterium sp. TSSA_36]|uniref:MBG domain-containing protein n=1 Tax=Flavobacterium sp. TSSA_36 TaxID=3447669 RepID=UPI003F3CB632
MRKKILVLGFLLSFFASLQSQTTLSAGDIAIIGVNFDSSPNYELTIVTLVPIAANTQIYISDYWYNESTPNKLTNVQASTGNALNSEGAILWTTNAAIPAGTVYKISIVQGGNSVTGLPGTVSVTGWSTPTGTPSSIGGDNWFIYQGTSVTDVTNFVFLWGNGSPNSINTFTVTPGQFVPSGSGNLSSNGVTYLPPSLTLGTYAIALTVDPTLAPGGLHADNNVYNGIRSGTKAAILAAICNKSNWTKSETTFYDISPGGTNFSGTNPIFNITTPNNAPTNITLSASAIDENIAANSTVGSLSSTDADSGNTFTYTLVAGTGSTDNASFNISGSNLRISASPDFETKSSYSVRIRTTDQGSLTFEKAFTITINDLSDINQAPTDIALSASAIDENVVANSTVGALSSTDVDSSSFTYSLVAGAGDTDNASFSISGSDLKITASPDFETKDSYSVRVRTFDGTSTFEKAFTIFINDVNEAPTDITLSASTINENVPANSTVGALSSTDVDTSAFTYSLVAGAGDTDNIAFSISGSDLRITASPNFETKSSYSVRVRTFDGTSTFEKAFTISINDVNEAPTDITLSAAAIDENVAANSTVGALSTTDVDTSAFTYSLVAGAGDTDNIAFSISGSDLRITASPNFETKSSYSVRVRTFDGTSTFEKAFTIFINDVNEAPTDITLSASAINENVPANSTVGALSSTDVDTSAFTYSLVAGAGDTDNIAFSISGSDLRITASPNFETKSSYSVRVRTFDGTSTFEKAFTISINDVNEAPTDITLSAAAIDENVAVNSTVGSFSSTDADSGNTFTYTLVAGTGSTDNASFNISGSNLRITASPDFETKSSYSVRIRTTDQGSLTFEKVFTITINDLSDINQAPTDISLSASAIDENVTANSTVGTLSSTDVDTSAFTYSLVAGAGDTDNASFSISGSDLKITASPDFETKSSYSVRVRTFDGTSTFEKAFTISINDINEAPTDITLSASAINENVAANSTVGALSTTDVDTSTFTYSLVAGTGDTDNAAYSISGSDLKITASPDFETKSSYSVRVRTFDGTSTFEKAFTISINDINEAPTDISLSAAAIDENVAANSTVGSFSSTDADSGNTFNYTLVAGTGSTDNASFSILGSDLRITTSPDFETKSSYSVRVQTFDGTSTFEKAFTISINDVNEAPTDITLSAAAIDENVAANSIVGSFSSTDADSGNTFTYTLVAGTGSTDNASFNISGSNLRITASPDFETKSSYSVRIRTTDQGSLTFEKAFTISINDVNEAPTDIALSALVINERVATNSTVGAFTSTDFDSGNTFTYSLVNGLGDADNASFSISGATLLIATSPDFETKASYSIRVKATDENGLFFEKQFTITINDVCELDGSLTLANDTLNPTQTNVSCNGGTNGSASVTPQADASGYTYSWSPSGGTAATATGLAAGSYTVTITGANSCTTTRNFIITEPTAINFSTTILSGYDYNTGYSQAIVTSGGTGSKTYAVTAGSLPSGFSLSSAGQITGISTQIADSNFTVTATDANNCTATYDYVLKLNQIPITVTATPSQTKVYGESDSVLTYTVSPSLLAGDSFTGALTRVSGEDIDNYTISQGSLSAGSKYLITFVGTNFTITAKSIIVTATPSQTKIYGTADPVFTYTVSPNLVGSDAFSGSLTRVAGENIGTYTINQGSLSAGSNYTISYADANFTITAKPITVTATPSQTKVYGATDPIFGYTVSPSLVGSDAFSGALTRVAGENTGNYAITQGNLSAGSNYTITYVSKDFAITAKPITVTADASQTKVYGTANPVYSYTVSPSLVSGDSFTGTLTRTAGENIGNYAITQGNLSAGSNYNITYVSKDFTITAKPITVTADASQTKVYGTTDPIFAYTVSPSLVNGDSFTGTLTRAAGENVGVYAITQGSLSAGGNYTIMFNGANFTITKADQVITWNQTLGLGCNGETSLVLTAISTSGLAVNYTSSNTTIASLSNNSLLFQNYGAATITASQTGNMNYNAAPNVVLPVVTSQPNLIRKQFENIIFFDNSSKSFKSYSWYKNGVLVPSQTSQYFKESSALNGTYYAVATKLDGTLITTCPLTLSPTVEEEYIRIVPNPVRSNANFQLITNVSSSKLQNARVELFNLIGNLLTTINTSQNTIDMIAPSVEGIYIVKMTLANGKYFTKNLLVKY